VSGVKSLLQCESKNVIRWSFLNFFPTAENFKAKFYMPTVCWNLWPLQHFIQLSLHLTQLCHIKCNQLTWPVRCRTGWRPTVPTSLQRMNGHQIHQTSATWLSCVGCNASGISLTSLKARDYSGTKKCTAADLGWLATDNDQQGY